MTGVLTDPPDSITARRPSGAPSRGGRLGWVFGLALADRRGWVRLATMALGVGLCGMVVLCLAAIPRTLDAASTRARTFELTYSTATPTFEGSQQSYTLAGRDGSGMLVRALADDPPHVPGTNGFPAPGQLYVTPALAALLADPAQESVRRLLPGDVVGIIDPAVLVAPDQLFFVMGVDESDATALYWFGTTGWGIDEGRADQALTPDLWAMVFTGAIVVMIPLLLFTALAARIGAARRDRRSAALRLLGASRGQLRALVVVEALLASLLGVAAAWGGLALVRLLIPDGRFGLRTADITVPAWTVALLVLVLPVFAVVAALVGTRRTWSDPLEVRTGQTRIRVWWRWLLAAFAAAGLVAVRFGSVVLWQANRYGTIYVGCLLALLVLCAVAGVVGAVVRPLAHWIRGGGPAITLATGRVRFDSASTTKTAAALATVLAGSIALVSLTTDAYREAAVAGGDTNVGSYRSSDPAEAARMVQSLATTSGVSRVDLQLSLSTNDRESALPTAIDVEVGTCPDLERRFGTFSTGCADGQAYQVAPDQSSGAEPLPPAGTVLQVVDARNYGDPPVTFAFRLPAGLQPVQLSDPADGYGSAGSWFGIPTVLVTPAAVPAVLGQLTGTPVLWSVQLAAQPGAEIAAQAAIGWAGAAGLTALGSGIGSARSLNDQLTAVVRFGLLGCGLLTLLICALGQALAAADQLREQRRSFAVARAGGVPVATLTRSVLAAAVGPVLVAVIIGLLAGWVLGVRLVRLERSVPRPVDWTWALSGAAAALVLTVAVAGWSAWRLRVATGPAALRTE